MKLPAGPARQRPGGAAETVAVPVADDALAAGVGFAGAAVGASASVSRQTVIIMHDESAGVDGSSGVQREARDRVVHCRAPARVRLPRRPAELGLPWVVIEVWEVVAADCSVLGCGRGDLAGVAGVDVPASGGAGGQTRESAFRLQQQEQQIELIGPLPAPMERKAGRFRFQLHIKSASRPRLQRFLQALAVTIEADKTPSQVRWSLDVDAQDLL